MFLLVSISVKLIPYIKSNYSSIITEIKEASGVANNRKDYEQFLLLQCGVYKNEDFAQLSENVLKKYGDAFSIKTNDTIKVYAGMYDNKSGAEVIKTLTKAKVPVLSIPLKINKTDLCNNEIIEIVTAELQILNKLRDKSIESIKTKSFKQWSSDLTDVSSTATNYDVLRKLQLQVEEMPSEIAVKDTKSYYIELYNVLNKIK